MFGKILYMSASGATIEIAGALATNLMNMHIVFEEENSKIIAEIEDISDKEIKVHFLGEIVGDHFLGGVIRKPSTNSHIRLINQQEFATIIGGNSEGAMPFGVCPLYNDYPIYVKINELLSNHLMICGNTGSGKSFGVSRLLQNVFTNSNVIPYKANFLIFDAYGEYHNAFQEINKINPNFNFKYYTTNLRDPGEKLSIPLFLLDIDDMALLLNATSHSQLMIIERMLKLVRILAGSNEESVAYKNHLIAKAIMTILYTNQTSASKRNDVFAILATCSTPQFNLEAPVQGIGYVRKFRECFTIDTAGNFPESNLMTSYISSFIKDELDNYEVSENRFYTMEDLEKALEFTLISEGLLRNEKMYSEAITLKVRLHSLAISQEAIYFNYPKFTTVESYIASLITANGRRAQIVNFNLDDIDDGLAKTIVKIYSKMLFNFTKSLPQRASIPFHVFLEEAHRYVQEDDDKFLLGYNIFERIAKEGRKYGLMLNLISQRPVELSDTVISQCSNFIIFKMNHPRDLEYIKKMLPNINEQIVEKQKTLQPGTCVAFGKAFRIPVIVKMEKPNPEPYSSNCDVVKEWSIPQQK